jgi:TetR/AcrR family transcriptional repressor of lmrAB and yxaGH operons
MSTTRDDILSTAARLMETQGYFGTGLNQIVAESGAPKGSLYYYFPEGKEELAMEAVQRVSRILADHTRQELAAWPDPAEAVYQIVMGISQHVLATECQAGSPVAAIALETASTPGRVNQACRDAYRRLTLPFAERLQAAGYAHERAAALATLINAAIEGGVILSRTYHDAAPLQTIAAELRHLIQAENPT